MHKNKGETPLQALKRLKIGNLEAYPQGIPDSEPLTYAGRLDPMAEGLLLVLIGKDENRRRDRKSVV